MCYLDTISINCWNINSFPFNLSGPLSLPQTTDDHRIDACVFQGKIVRECFYPFRKDVLRFLPGDFKGAQTMGESIW